MQRFAAVWHASPQKMVGILFALLLAAMMAVGSGANFNSTSANANNVVAAGTLSHTPGTNGAFLQISNIKPGETKSGTITMTNTGSVDGLMAVGGEVATDSTAPANPFAERLNLTITNGDGDELYNGLLSDLEADGPSDQSLLADGDTDTYTFAVEFLDGGAPNGSDNIYQSANVTADFDWELVSN
jgi:spore coat-associated protein N